MENNRLKQEHLISQQTIESGTFDVISVIIKKCDLEFSSFLSKGFSMKMEDKDGDILLSRELYIFTPEELEQLITKIKEDDNRK